MIVKGCRLDHEKHLHSMAFELRHQGDGHGITMLACTRGMVRENVAALSPIISCIPPSVKPEHCASLSTMGATDRARWEGTAAHLQAERCSTAEGTS